MTTLVTGGAGYIGSHVLKKLIKQGEEVIVVDNLSTGHVQALKGAELLQFDISEVESLSKVFQERRIDSILHFAGSIVVPESVALPIEYYKNNTVNSLILVDLARKFSVRNFVFSSTAAVYGVPKSGICTEDDVVTPINPYGYSKLMTEQMLQDAAKANNFNYVILRYFNVAGADGEGDIGQSFPIESHLIKIAVQVALGKRDSMQIYGDDYDTPDGTCIRDYIHVEDLASAHVDALNYLRNGGASDIFNLGYGTGFSVKEVIQVVEEVAGKALNVITGKRRAGDPPKLIADSSKAQQKLGWRPVNADLKKIVKSAFDWEKMRKY